MRETTVPANFPLDPSENLTDVVVGNAARRPALTVLSRPGEGGPGQSWEPVTSVQFLAEVMATAKGLVAGGVEAGDRVALLARTRYEWTLFDFAIWFCGAITVPIYETSSPEQIRWILPDSAASAVVVETPAHAAAVSGLQGDLPELKRILTIDDGAVAELAAAGAGVDDDEIERRRRTLVADSVATIIYTSGTTGRPKGCELSHANFLGLARSALTVVADLVHEQASTLLFLPLAHVFARYVQVLSLVAGSNLAHTPTVANLVDDLGSFRPTYLLAVPRVFEKIYNSAEARAEASGRGAIFNRAADTAVEYSQAQDAGGAGLVLRLKHALFDRLVYSKLRAATGGRINGVVSGGAPLGPRLGHFFRGIGLTIIEGWGLTETTAPVTVNRPAQNKIGSVGLPLPGNSVRLGPDDEIQVKGVGVLLGYYNNPEGAHDITDGWFSTGDLGSIDDDGFLTITGRKKEILVTAGGKNVIPGQMEDRLRAHPLVSQTIVVGDGKPFIAALITLDAEMLPGWLSTRGKGEMSLEQAAADPDVRAELQKAVDAANATVSKAESIRKFTVLTTDFTEAGGQLTPKLSIKRAVVMKEFSDEIEALYS